MLKRKTRRKVYAVGTVLFVAFSLAVATAGAWGRGPNVHACPWWAWWC